jgi:hypothetical protein
MREITTKVYKFDELNAAAQADAIDKIRDSLSAGWDSHDNDDIREVMVYMLAEKFQAPGWDTYGPGDFPGIDRVTMDGFDMDRYDSLALSGTVDRDNAPALPWVDGIDSVEMTSHRSDATMISVRDDDDAAVPATDDQRNAMEQSIRDAISAAWQAGEKECEYKTGEEWARELAADREFLANGEPF